MPKPNNINIIESRGFIFAHKQAKIILRREKIMNFIKKALSMLILAAGLFIPALAETHSISTDFTINIPEYMNIRPITSPVLTAHITDRTGNMYMPLSSTFRVSTNASQTKTLYLQSNITTEGGYESSMFMQGGQVYIAFASLSKIPKSYALANCKMGGSPKDSPGVVAYPITSVHGAEHKYIPSKSKYEVYVENGTTDITVNVGANILRNSFAANDPRGFYQATLSLTEVDL